MQGNCGSCYAFAVIGTIEAWHKISTGETISLSEQEIIDCAPNRGCHGGYMAPALKYIHRKGISLQEIYRYNGVAGHCRRNYVEKRGIYFGLAGFQTHAPGMQSLLKAAAKGPLMVQLYAPYAFYSYKGGLFYERDCHTPWKFPHAMILMGYGSTAEGPHLLLKNSWDNHWGEKGHMRMQFNPHSGDPRGPCGVAQLPSYTPMLFGRKRKAGNAPHAKA